MSLPKNGGYITKQASSRRQYPFEQYLLGLVRAGRHEKSPAVDWAILLLAELIGTHIPADKQNSFVHSINTAEDASAEDLSDYIKKFVIILNTY